MTDRSSSDRDVAHALAAPTSAVTCALVLLVDQLEASGALQPGHYTQALRTVITQSGIDGTHADGRFLMELVSLLSATGSTRLTVINGGRSQDGPSSS